MKTIYHILIVLFLALYTISSQAALMQLPAELNFATSEERAKWQFVNTSNAGSNTWMVGNWPEYAYGDSAMLFLTNDGGTTRAYTENAIAYNDYRCMAYYPLDSLPAGQYMLNFHYRGISAANSHIYIYLYDQMNLLKQLMI